MQNLFCGGLFVPLLRHDLEHGAPGGAEFDRDDAGVADDLAAKAPDLGQVLIRILHLDGEVVNAGSRARGERFGGSFGVVLD